MVSFEVEDEVLRRIAVLARPEVDEAEDLFGFLALADVGVGIAEHLAVGILGEEREDAGLATASFGQVVGFDQRMLAEIGHGVKIEIDGLAGEEGSGCWFGMPFSQQVGDLLRCDPRGVLRQEAFFGNDVEAAEPRHARVGDECHDVALAFDGPQFERQCGTQRVAGWDHARAGKLGAAGHGLAVEADQISHE